MDLETEIKCPSCGRNLKIKAREMIPGRSQNCPGCGTRVRFSGDDGRKTQKALDDVTKTLKKGINIRL